MEKGTRGGGGGAMGAGADPPRRSLFLLQPPAGASPPLSPAPPVGDAPPAPPQPPTLTPPSPADRLRAATAALALVDAPLPPPALDASIGSGGSHGLPPRPSPRPSAAASPRRSGDAGRGGSHDSSAQSRPAGDAMGRGGGSSASLAGSRGGGGGGGSGAGRSAAARAPPPGQAPAGAGRRSGKPSKAGETGKKDGKPATPRGTAATDSSAPRPDSIFAHLPPFRRTTAESVLAAGVASARKLHPEVLRLGLRVAAGEVAGGAGRAAATLAALRAVVADYSTPPGRVLSRDLAVEVNASVAFLVECRPLSAATGAAVKHVKLAVSRSDPSAAQSDAKASLLASMDAFAAERLHGALASLASRAAACVDPGDVVLTFSHSAAVMASLKAAAGAGVPFRAVVVDARPDLAGRKALAVLTAAGIPVTYVPLTALAYMLPEATKVMLGAAAVLANGVVVARAGTAAVALAADAARVPVIVCAETVKFQDRVQLDSITHNELRDPEALLSWGAGEVGGGAATASSIPTPLPPRLSLLNLAYDACPPECVTMVVTEMGAMPPSSVPVVLREFARQEQGA